MIAKRKDSKFGCFGNVFVVRFRSSRWRRASNCKLHIQNLLSSVKLHRRRRECIVRQSRSDIALLLPNGRFSEALPKAKQFYEDERRILAYDQVEYFCTSVLKNFPLIKHQKDVHLLPEDAKEAMAGLIFAASRIGELQELQYVRSLFVQRFGLEFDKDCVDLRPGNLVSSAIVEILDTNMPEDVITRETVMEISQKHQTNITTSVVDSSITEDSVSINNLGNDDSDSEKIEKLKRVFLRKRVLMENSKFLHPNLGESQGRDRSSFMR